MKLNRIITLIAALAMLLVALPAVASAADRDSDGMSDAWEKSNRVGLAHADIDRDGVDNLNEYQEGTRARDRDSDDDRRSDGREDRDRDGLNNAAEDATGNHPRDRDSDNDGILDGKEQAGVVTAINGDELTITLAGSGGEVTAKVTEDTDTDCATEQAAESGAANTGATVSRRGGDNSGPGNSEDELGASDDDSDESGDDDGGGRRGHRGSHGDRRGSCRGFGRGDDNVDCPEGVLKVGAKVHEASLKVTSDGKVWREIQILIPAAPTS